MNPHLDLNLKESQMGFSLVELIIVIAVLGIVSAVVMMRGPTPAAMTLPSQAQTLASDIRRAQTLAYTSGNRMRVTATPSGNTYSVLNCSGTPACTITTTTTNFPVTLEPGVTFKADSTATLEFDTLGRPVAVASYTLVSDSGDTKTVSVAALTGLVTVAP